MNIEQMKKIVEGAPSWAVAVNINNGMYYDKSEVSKGDIWLIDLRSQLEKHDTLDLEPSDIPHGCVVVEK